MRGDEFDPGEMDQRVVIQEEQNVPDGAGGSSLSWVNVGSAFLAKVRPMTGRERFNSDQLEVPTNYMVVMRVRTITEKQRMLWVSNNNLPLNIRFVPQTPRELYIGVEAEAGVRT